jgi:two-component system response regulator HydG
MTNQNSVGIIGKSLSFLKVLDLASRVARSDSRVLIRGESGTGKEVIARFIHLESRRGKGPFVAVNCSSIPEDLLESELFGHARGSFTGAVENKVGLFEEAENGTLFLDEIGDFGVGLQAKILRVIQEKSFRRVGENKTRSVNARVIAATHQNLEEQIVAGNFREDLYFRLNVIPVCLPALRERQEDILPLAEHFLEKFASKAGGVKKTLTPQAEEYLVKNSWKGNVRELENAIERAVVLSSRTQVDEADFKLQDITMSGPVSSHFDNEKVFYVPLEGGLVPLKEVIDQYVEYAVMANHGAKDKTARELGIDRKTLYKRIATHTAVHSSAHSSLACRS